MPTLIASINIFNILQEVPVSAVRQRKRNKAYQLEEEEIKLSLLADDHDTLHRRALKSPHKNYQN